MSIRILLKRVILRDHGNNTKRISYSGKEGIISPVLNVTCDYKKTTTFSDVVTISVGVQEFKGVKLHLVYEMKNEDGQVVCAGTSSHAFLNEEGRPIRMKQEQPKLYEALSELVGEK